MVLVEAPRLLNEGPHQRNPVKNKLNPALITQAVTLTLTLTLIP